MLYAFVCVYIHKCACVCVYHVVYFKTIEQKNEKLEAACSKSIGTSPADVWMG